MLIRFERKREIKASERSIALLYIFLRFIYSDSFYLWHFRDGLVSDTFKERERSV